VNLLRNRERPGLGKETGANIFDIPGRVKAVWLAGSGGTSLLRVGKGTQAKAFAARDGVTCVQAARALF
jgi:hypothetical protein